MSEQKQIEQRPEYVIITGTFCSQQYINSYAADGYQPVLASSATDDLGKVVPVWLLCRQPERTNPHAALHDALEGDITSLGKRIDMTEQQLRQTHIAREAAQEKIDQFLVKRLEELQRARESHCRSLDALCGRVEALQQRYNLMYNELVDAKQLVFAVERRALDLTETVKALEATTKNLEIQSHSFADNASITEGHVERIDKALDRLEAEIVAVRRKAGYEDGESIQEKGEESI